MCLLMLIGKSQLIELPEVPPGEIQTRQVFYFDLCLGTISEHWIHSCMNMFIPYFSKEVSLQAYWVKYTSNPQLILIPRLIFLYIAVYRW